MALVLGVAELALAGPRANGWGWIPSIVIGVVGVVLIVPLVFAVFSLRPGPRWVVWTDVPPEFLTGLEAGPPPTISDRRSRRDRPSLIVAPPHPADVSRGGSMSGAEPAHNPAWSVGGYALARRTPATTQRAATSRHGGGDPTPTETLIGVQRRTSARGHGLLHTLLHEPHERTLHLE